MTSVSPAQQKAQLRRLHLAQRAGMKPREVESQSAALCQQLITWFASERDIQQVFLFNAIRQEPNLDLLAEYLAPRFPLALPVCDGKGTMNFYRWLPGDPLRTNRWNILEPLVPPALPLAADRKTVILVPCLAADKFGHRLGYGAGFYDTYLSKNPLRTTIGVLWQQCIESSSIPAEAHDIRLNYLCSEQALVPTLTDPVAV